MTRTFLDLSGRLPSLEEALREVDRVASLHGTPFFIVGALARDIIMKLAYGIEVRRFTTDLDCGVRVNSSEGFRGVWGDLLATGKFRSDPKESQRVVHESGLIVDAVPFGPIDKGEGAILWPPEGEVKMSTLGLEEAYESAIMVRLADGLDVLVTSPAGLALTKLFSWTDRPHERARDAIDIGFIMSNYIDAGNRERVYEEGGDAVDLLEDYDDHLSNARLLGRDVGKLLAAHTRPALMSILEGQTGERNAYPLVEAMIKGNYRGDFDAALGALEMLKKGVAETAP